MIGDVDEQLLGIGAAARRLGVTPSTLRSWERRYGMTRPAGAPGTHRRYSPADLARLAAMHHLIADGMPVAAAAALVTPGAAASPRPAEIAARLRAADDALDAPLVAAFLYAALTRHGAVTTWEQILTPLLTELGERWCHDQGGIDREHLLSDAAYAALRTHAYSAAATEGSPALLAATPGERHTLPLAALAAALAERGTPAVLLADLPPADLAGALAAVRPHATLLWSRTSATASAPALDALTRPGRTVYAAGPGWQPGALPAAVTHVGTLADALLALGHYPATDFSAERLRTGQPLGGAEPSRG